MINKSISSKELINIAEKFTDVITKETKSGLLIFIQHGARLLGMFPDHTGDNVLWVNPELETSLQENHALVGGERMWISPQRNFFYENPRDFEGFHIPSEVDPGQYQCIDDTNTVIFKNIFSLLEFDKNKLFDDSIAKREFTPIDDPYNTNFPYAGVNISDSVIINDTKIEIGICSITKVYSGGLNNPGTIFLPVKRDCKLINYFNSIPKDFTDTFEIYSRYKIDGVNLYKIGIQPKYIRYDNPCKELYLSPSFSDNNIWSCIIKRSNDIPKTQIECIDIPKNNPKGSKGAIQASNSKQQYMENELTEYGELELQFTKGSAQDDKTICKATHEILSYTGTKDEMLVLAQTAMQLDKKPMVY